MQENKLTERYRSVLSRIERAALRCGRQPDEIRLVAVSKTKPASAVREAAAAGAVIFGENYVQEARQKSAELGDLPLKWHLIGHLQSNKAKYAVRIFDLIHTVDSFRLAAELDCQAARIGKVQPVLVQVNLGGAPGRAGVPEDQAESLVARIAAFEHLKIEGLMALPPYFDQPEKARPYFARLRQLRDRIRDARIGDIGMSELSMGMTGDFEAAIEEGATLVRVGTAIFGGRQ